jgi:cob(I)alamin adenosyltransferase
MLGLIHIYTGAGKGKTTVALGLALRAVGAGLRVAIVFFDKGGKVYSERESLEKLGVDYFSTGMERFNPETGEFRFGVTKEDVFEAKKGLRTAKRVLQGGKYDLVILDEINTVAAQKMVDTADVLKLLEAKPKNVELVLTGRGASQEILDKADLITEMYEIKHYYRKGVKARKGIDY